MRLLPLAAIRRDREHIECFRVRYSRESLIKYPRQGNDPLSRAPRPQSEKLVPGFPADIYYGNRPSGHPMLR
jgi:hypothetical protein